MIIITALVAFCLAMVLLIGVLCYLRTPVTYTCSRCNRECLPTEIEVVLIGSSRRNEKHLCLNCYYDTMAEQDGLDPDIMDAEPLD